MKTSAEGIALIKKFEGCELKAYQCSASVWTIGYGHTSGVEEASAAPCWRLDRALALRPRWPMSRERESWPANIRKLEPTRAWKVASVRSPPAPPPSPRPSPPLSPPLP